MARDLRRDHGFTLVEVLIAIMITGMLFLGFFSIIRNGINTQIMVREFSDAERAGPSVIGQLSDDLRNAYFYNIEGNAAFFGKSIDRGGDSRMDQIHLLTTRTSVVGDDLIAPDAEGLPPGSPLTEVSWMLREGSNGFFELVRREQPFCDNEQFKGGYLRLISDRIVSFKVQYTGWDFGADEEEGDAAGAGNALAGAGAAGANPLGGENPDEQEGLSEDGGLIWEDDWSAQDKGALPVAVKIELVISPDIDPAVMARMQYEGRLTELERSYLQIVLLPQYREGSETMRRTYAWTGSVAEPQFAVGGGVAGGVGGGGAAGGARGDARGRNAGDRGRGAGGGGGGNPNGGNLLGGAGAGGGGNRLAEILGGGR